MLQGISGRAPGLVRAWIRARGWRSDRAQSAAALVVAAVGLTLSMLIAIFSR
jgi:hypothetical protein